MLHRRYWTVGIIALVVIGLLILGGSAIHRAGWSQGFLMGQLAAGGEGGAAVPYGLYDYPGWGSSVLGLFLKIGLAILVIVVILKFLRVRAWKATHYRKAARAAGRPPAEHWAEHWHRPVPPWWWGWEKPAEEEAEESEPEAEAEAGAAEA